MRRQWLKILAICSGSMVGCANLQEAKQDYLIDYRNTKMAEEAWKSMSGEYNNMYMVDFERGWKQGYYDVASGGAGCAPAVPPSRYWHIRYQNACGQQRVMAWLNGYREGALVAEQDGVAAYSAIPTWFQGDNCNKCGKKPQKPVTQPRMDPAPPAPRPVPPGRGDMVPVPPRPQNSTPKNGVLNGQGNVGGDAGNVAPAVLPKEKTAAPKLPPALPPTSSVNGAAPPIASTNGTLTPSGLTTAVPLYGKSDSKS